MIGTWKSKRKKKAANSLENKKMYKKETIVVYYLLQLKTLYSHNNNTIHNKYCFNKNGIALSVR